MSVITAGERGANSDNVFRQQRLQLESWKNAFESAFVSFIDMNRIACRVFFFHEAGGFFFLCSTLNHT